VVGVYRLLKIALMALVTIGEVELEISIGVTRLALYCSMFSCQW